jgi:phthalate 4,5-dioxygenase oxygenase subunit
MRAGSWTGIDGFQNQDIAAQESMGAIVDRSREHLGMSDIAVIRMRRRMLANLAALEAGETPLATDASIPYDRIASEQRIIALETPWQVVGAFALEAT